MSPEESQSIVEVLVSGGFLILLFCAALAWSVWQRRKEERHGPDAQ